MGIDLKKILSATLSSPRANLRSLKLDDFDRMFGVRGDLNYEDRKAIAKNFWLWTEEVRDMGEKLHAALSLTRRMVSSGVVIAYQHLTLSSTNVSTTEVADDTLSFQSATDVEFDWLDSRRINVVMLGPGDAVRPMRLIWDADRNLEDSGNYAGTVFPIAGNKLQRMSWDGSDWVGIAWDKLAGWTVDAYQLSPTVLQELP